METKTNIASLSDHDQSADHEKIVDVSSANFFDAENNSKDQECLKNVQSFAKRYNELISLTFGDYSEPESFSIIVEKLKDYGIENISSFKGLDYQELSMRIRGGDFQIIEDLFISKMTELGNSSLEKTELELRVMELISLAFASTQMFDVISLNSSRKKDIKKCVFKLNKYFGRLFVKLSGILGADKINELQKEVSLYLDVAHILVNSEIPIDGNASKAKMEEMFTQKDQVITSTVKSFVGDNELSHTMLATKEQFLNRAGLLRLRLSLQYNAFQQAAHFNTKCKLDKKQFNITRLKKSHNIGVYKLINLFYSVCSKKINPKVNDDGSLLNESEKAKKSIYDVLNIFIDSLKGNHKDIGVLFEIVESILYFSANVDMDMVCEFQDNINQLLNRNKRFFHGDLNLFNASMRILYENKSKLADIQKESKIDPLTGINNRRSFDESLDEFIHKANRGTAYHGIMIFDIDKFKLINDTYGHHGGDAVLSVLTDVVSKAVRNDSDKFFRYGGEEFVILFEVEDEKGAEKFAEKIRSIVEKNVAEQVREKNQDNKDLDTLSSVTVSVGYTQVPKNNYKLGDVSNDVMVHADNALYYSKDNGRNRVTKYSEKIILNDDKKSDK